MEIGVFEAIPSHGSIGIKELAEKCEADEALIGSLPSLLPLLKRPMLTRSSPIDETAHLSWHLYRAQAGSVGTQPSLYPAQHPCRLDCKVLFPDLVSQSKSQFSQHKPLPLLSIE